MIEIHQHLQTIEINDNNTIGNGPIIDNSPYPVERFANQNQEWEQGVGKSGMSSSRIVREDEMETNAKKRVIFLNDDLRNAKYPYKSNYIKTTKYTIITFLPVALFYQFLRVANIYFLMIAILQSIPAISPLNPATAIMPLAFVL